MDMLFAVLSINYIDTPIEIRDQVSLSDTKKMEMVTFLRNQGIQQSVLLSTCNRFEVYVLLQEECAVDLIKDVFQNMFSVQILKYIKTLVGMEAIQYIFEVSAGLQSMVLGEDQILGQVKDAVAFARRLGCLNKAMEKIFREAITSAKRLKQNLKISEHPLSISYIGIQQLNSVCEIKDKKVLVLGSGKVAELAITYVCDYGASCIWNCNRSIHKALSLKEQFPIVEIFDFTKRYELLKECDIVISATSSPHIVLQNNNDEIDCTNIYMLDLATPRDIDPSFPHVFNIDSLQEVANEHRCKRCEKAMLGKEYLAKDVAELHAWLTTSSMDQTLQTVQEHIDMVVEDTYAILDQKLSLNDRERYILKKTLQSSMHRLMKKPILNLKNVEDHKQESYQQLIEHLFEQPEKEGTSICTFD